MADGDKTVKITGRVEIDQSNVQGALTAMVAELKAVRAGWENSAKAITDVEKNLKQVNSETGKASASVNIFKGMWQGVGQAISATTILAGVKMVANSMADAAKQAKELRDVMSELGRKGAEDISALKTDLVELAAEMRTNLIVTAKAFKDAFSVSNDQVLALQVTRDALDNYKKTGADAGATIRASEQIIKSFNLAATEQSSVIRRVAQAARDADIGQDQMYDSIAKLAPVARLLGTDLNQLLNVTVNGVRNGLMPAAKGIQGLGEVMEQLLNPSEEFKKVLLDSDLIMVASETTWRNQSKLVGDMKKEYEALNAEIRGYQRTASEIGMINSEAQRRIDQYEELAQKQQSGQRLSRDEKAAMRELESQLRSYNKELAQFDDLTGVKATSSSRKMTVVMEQLQTRITAGAEAQKDLGEKAARAQHELGGLEATMVTAQSQLDVLAAKLQNELPAAIRAAIAGDNFGPFLAELSKTTEAVALLSPNGQAVVEAQAGLNAIHSSAADAEAGLAGIPSATSATLESATSHKEAFQSRWATLKTALIEPFTESQETIFRVLNAIFSPSRIATIQNWSSIVAGTIKGLVADIATEFTTGLQTKLDAGMGWGEIILSWITGTWDRAVEGVRTLIQPLVDNVVLALNNSGESLAQAMIRIFKDAASRAIEAVKETLSQYFTFDWATTFMQPIANLTQGQNAFYNGNPNRPMEQATGMVQNRAESRSSSLTISPTINNTVADPVAVGQQVMREIHQLTKLGYNGGMF